MPNGTEYPDPDTRRILELPLRDLDPAVEQFATARAARVMHGNDTTLPLRAIYAGDSARDGAAAPQRMLRITAQHDFAIPKYDIEIVASVHEGRQLYAKQRTLATGVGDEALAAEFEAVAEAGWHEVSSWAVADLAPMAGRFGVD